MRKSHGLSGCPPQRRARPAPAPGFASLDLGLEGDLRGCCAHASGEQSRVQRKEADLHLSIRLKLTLISFCPPALGPLQSLSIPWTLAPASPVPARGHSSRIFCFVGGCREIVLCFVISLGVIVLPVFSCCLYGRVVGGSG